MTTEHVDVLVVGAGISGIGAGYYLQKYCPTKSYTILEARSTIGGTWDLFRYPGIRSDSDMYTLGYSFHPWRDGKAIADGPSILKYVRETAAAYGIDQRIRFNHRVCNTAWSSANSQWTVNVERATDSGQTEMVTFTCNFLYMCTGYYDYAKGYTPDWRGVDQFTGQLIHPQKWPDDLDYSGKRVIVIGSGATAVTLVPAMAEKAARVTMLQRTPTYVISMALNDPIVTFARRVLPAKAAYFVARWKSVLLSMFLYYASRWWPKRTNETIVNMVRDQLGPDFDVDTHFKPTYNVWDQRLCLVPNADLFTAIKSGNVDVITDEIDSFTQDGIRLRSGKELAADIIVTATGLVIKIADGIPLTVDGQGVDASKLMVYKGMMVSDLPNFAIAFGYTNASWTLKVELTSCYVCRLINYMDQHGYTTCTPRRHDPAVTGEPMLSFTSGYVQRALNVLPQQGSKRPWRVYQNYLMDMLALRFGTVNDGTMEFSRHG
jgi:cation diffusion facilitator CzcD-associated flavoprotein CzcO